MTKTELISVLAAKAGMTKAQAAKALNALTEVVTEAVAGGEKVAWSGLGTFEPTERAARSGRNPQTGATIQIAPSRAVRFRPGKALKDSVR